MYNFMTVMVEILFFQHLNIKKLKNSSKNYKKIKFGPPTLYIFT